MTRRATLTAAAVGMGAATFGSAAQAQTTQKTFVLVHGSFHGGWCWRRVSDRLEKLGHKVFTPTLTGLGERSHLLSDKIDLATHITDVVNVIKWEKLTNVVLCGHSYAGYPISGVAEEVLPAISSIVFLDAFMPENGDSIVEKGNPRVSQIIRDAAAKKEVSLKPLPASFFEVNEADRAWIDSMCTPQPLATYMDKIKLTGARERVPRKTYIRAKGYAQPAFDEVEAKVKADPTWRALTVPCGHDVMVDMPDRLTEILIEAAAV